MSVSSKEFLDIQATIECGFTLKHVRDMIITYSSTTGTQKLKNFTDQIQDSHLPPSILKKAGLRYVATKIHLVQSEVPVQR